MLASNERDAPLDWYLWMGLFTGASLLLVVAPEFVQSAIKGKFDIGLVGQGVQARANQVKNAIAGTGSTIDPSSPVDEATINTMFGNFSSLQAPAIIGIGGAEGTLDGQGNPTAIYNGHTDPGNGAWNKGFGSWQASSVSSAEEGDRLAFNRLKTECVPDAIADAKANGVTLTPGVLAQVCDMWIQAPLAATDAMVNLKKCQDQGKKDSEAWLCMRVQSYYNPQGSLEASGFGNSIDRLTADQQRRMDEVSHAMESFKPSTPVVPSPATTTDSGGSQIASDPTQAIAKLQVGSGTCTAFFVNASEVLTAGHCFKSGQSGTLTMADGKTATATFKITAAPDVAVAVVDGSFPYLEKAIGANSQVQIKGYRLEQWTESTGVAAGKDERGNWTFSASPTIEPGYSGAPLLQNGKWIGVVVGKNPNVAVPSEQIAF